MRHNEITNKDSDESSDAGMHIKTSVRIIEAHQEYHMHIILTLSTMKKHVTASEAKQSYQCGQHHVISRLFTIDLQ